MTTQQRDLEPRVCLGLDGPPQMGTQSRRGEHAAHTHLTAHWPCPHAGYVHKSKGNESVRHFSFK